MLSRLRKALRALRGRQKMPRARCPRCGRMVAITANGLTFYHGQFPGTASPRYHTVRLSDGVEV